MAWQNPKTDWVINPKNPAPEDFNRIEGNIDFLKQDIETKKGLIVDAINYMNQPAQVTDTYAQLANKIRDISKDATAAVGDVKEGKMFYAGGQKRTGTMPNRGAVIITPSTQNQTILAGYHNGQGYVKGDADLKASNIKKGINIFGITGSFEGYVLGANDLLKTGYVSKLTWKRYEPIYYAPAYYTDGPLLVFSARYTDPQGLESNLLNFTGKNTLNIDWFARGASDSRWYLYLDDMEPYDSYLFQAELYSSRGVTSVNVSSYSGNHKLVLRFPGHSSGIYTFIIYGIWFS